MYASALLKQSARFTYWALEFHFLSIVDQVRNLLFIFLKLNRGCVSFLLVEQKHNDDEKNIEIELVKIHVIWLYWLEGIEPE